MWPLMAGAHTYLKKWLSQTDGRRTVQNFSTVQNIFQRCNIFRRREKIFGVLFFKWVLIMNYQSFQVKKFSAKCFSANFFGGKFFGGEFFGGEFFGGKIFGGFFFGRPSDDRPSETAERPLDKYFVR